MLKRKETFIETRRREKITLTQQNLPKTLDAFCSACGRSVEWLTTLDVARMTSTEPDEVRRRIENGDFDIRVNGHDQILVCASSAIKPARTPKT